MNYSNDRRGVLVLFFDLPVVSKEDRYNYRTFKRAIKLLGYVQWQEFVYIKIVHNISSFPIELQALRNIVPSNGQVDALPININVFKKLQELGGTEDNNRLNDITDDIIFV